MVYCNCNDFRSELDSGVDPRVARRPWSSKNKNNEGRKGEKNEKGERKGNVSLHQQLCDSKPKVFQKR